MAEHLASVFGTEKDRVNYPFYFKIGACRHGDRVMKPVAEATSRINGEKLNDQKGATTTLGHLKAGNVTNCSIEQRRALVMQVAEGTRNVRMECCTEEGSLQFLEV